MDTYCANISEIQTRCISMVAAASCHFFLSWPVIANFHLLALACYCTLPFRSIGLQLQANSTKWQLLLFAASAHTWYVLVIRTYRLITIFLSPLLCPSFRKVCRFLFQLFTRPTVRWSHYMRTHYMRTHYMRTWQLLNVVGKVLQNELVLVLAPSGELTWTESYSALWWINDLSPLGEWT